MGVLNVTPGTLGSRLASASLWALVRWSDLVVRAWTVESDDLG